MRICFDMDGTIANLYGVENWLEYLISENEYPYANAKVMLNMNVLARYLNRLQKLGFEIGVISWLAKNSSENYDKNVTIAKKKWLVKHLKSVSFDFIKIVPYGYAKETFCYSENDILFDDEIGNREAWKGQAFDEKNILEILKKLLDNAKEVC